MTIKEASILWNISERRVNELCKNGRILGAYKKNKKWFIPDNTQKPKDNRKSNEVTTSNAHGKKPLPVGVSDYISATTNYYYVDKTLLIKDFLDNIPRVSLFTRPRRFGKTLNMDMLRVFFEKTTEDTSIYFKDKKIWKYGDYYTKHQGRYPVIFLTFKDVKCLNWNDTFNKIRSLISLEFMRHNELETSEMLSAYEKEKYINFAKGNVDEIDCQAGLQILSLLLHKHYKQEAIIIIDEYDTPIEQGHTCNFYEETINFMRNFFSGGLKDNPHLAFGFLTGILRVAKESIFSGLNNLVINSILDNRYSEYFGFTNDEVKEILNYYEKENKYKEVCEWYDGYRFGDTDIFNPWSVISYFNNDCRPKAFWQSTGSNDIISEILANATSDIIKNLEALMKGESFITRIDTGVIYPQIQKDHSSIYSFLLVAGYLKAINHDQTYGEDYMCEVSLPNKEISFVYSKEILSKLQTFIPYSSAIAIQEAIYKNDIDALQKTLEHFLLNSVSFYDTSNETFYHGLILGTCAITDNSYKISSNREAGEGRFDIQMLPLNKKLPGILIEIKAEKDCTEAKLEKLAKNALEQINNNKYDVDLKSLKTSSIIKIGIAFSGKNIKIRSIRNTI